MKKFIFGLAVALCATSATMAEVSVSGGVDLVSSYTWRGIDQTGPALQPAISVGAGNFSLGAWGSTPLEGGAKELDFTLGYEIGGFAISLTDYWWSGESVPYFVSNSYNAAAAAYNLEMAQEIANGYADAEPFNTGQHQQEVTIGYTFGEGFPLSITWSTMVSGMLDTKLALGLSEEADGQAYSTYINFAYPFAVEGVDCTASVGITPWEGAYASEFNVASVAIRASKDIFSSDKFSLPLFVEVSAAPANHDMYLVAGMSFGF